MSSAVANGNGQQAQIWDGHEEGRSCSGKLTKRHMVLLGVLAGGAALALGLYFGLSKSDNSGSSERTVGQAYDPASLGCYVDVRRDRVMENRLTDEALTPAVSTERGVMH